MWRLTALAVLALAAPAPAASLRVTTPLEAVDAHPLGPALAAEVEVRGRAPRGAIVEVEAACRLAPCLATARAGRRRRFRAVLSLVLPARRRHVRLEVRTGEEAVTSTLDVVAAPDLATGPDLTLIGDSLAVGTEAPLRAALPGWRVTADGRVGRPLAEGMGVLGRLPARPRPDVLAMSLFTNDDPRGVDVLDAAVRASLERAPCVVWATVARRPVDGVGYRRANRRLKALAVEDGRLRVVDWAAVVRRHPDWLGRDHVHPTAAGYAARARRYAAAALSCASAPPTPRG